MTDRQFEYDESLLNSCATFAAASINKNPNDATASACETLYKSYLEHYSQPEDIDFNNQKFSKFVENVSFVWNHNTDETKRHKVTLNRFSNVLEEDLPLMNRVPRTEEEKMESRLEYMHEQLWQSSFTATEIFSVGSSRSDISNVPPFVKIEDEEDVLHAASSMRMAGSNLENNPHEDNSNFFQSMFLRHSSSSSSFYGKYSHKPPATTSPSDNMDNWGGDCDGCDFDKHLDWSTGNNPDGVPIVQAVMDQGTCGACWAIAATGTVEASASRTAARDAYVNYIPTTLPASSLPYEPSSPPEALSSSSLDENNDNDADSDATSDGEFDVPQYDDETINKNAIKAAQLAEAEALSIAKLSVQELLDCDTNFDQGCTGGNPLLAFFFIRRYGLTTAESYPYVGKMGLCQAEKVIHPVATVENWGILTPNHEDNMELVLRYLGPIAVGVYGGDPSFLSYQGGIFDSDTCTADADHAMLVVGYGEKVDDNGETVKYWIARNSWGEGWGENGYVRIKRGSGKKGHGGVCGVARSPSVALGGYLLVRRGEGGKLEELGRAHTASATVTAAQEIKRKRKEKTLSSPFCEKNGETWVVVEKENNGVLIGEGGIERNEISGVGVWEGLRREYCAAATHMDKNVALDLKSHDALVAFGSIFVVISLLSLWVFTKRSRRTNSQENVGNSSSSQNVAEERSRLLEDSPNVRYDIS